MIPGLLLVLAVAIVDWIAVAREWRKVELVAKPWTLAALLLFFLMNILGKGEPIPVPLYCFGAGLLFSLIGDIFLLLPEKWFLTGFGAFLAAQLAYITGFNIPLPAVPSLWSIGIAVVLALTTSRVLRQIIQGVRQKGFKRLVTPVTIYGMAVTIMLLSALLTMYREDWSAGASGLASLGAALFFLSDGMLAWNKFVSPIKHGRLLNMISYHLGQIAITVGVILQFTG